MAVAKAGWPARPAVLLLLVLALAGCAVSFIAPYDEQTDRMLTELARKVDVVLTDPAAEGAIYQAAIGDYESVRVDLRTLRLRNQARRANALTLEQLDAIEAAWDEIQAQHRTAGTLSPVFVLLARDTMAQTIGAAIRLELEKRRLR